MKINKQCRGQIYIKGEKEMGQCKCGIKQSYNKQKPHIPLGTPVDHPLISLHFKILNLLFSKHEKLFFYSNVAVFSVHYLFERSFQDIGPKILRNIWNPVPKPWLSTGQQCRFTARIKPVGNSYPLASMIKIEDVGKLRVYNSSHGLCLLCSIHPQNCSESMGKVLTGEHKNLDGSGYSPLELDGFQLLSWVGSENSWDIT